MDFDFNIFKNSKSFLTKLYSEEAKKLNDFEKEFRTNTRMKLHPDWKIFRYVNRKWITFGGIFDLNLTMYETKDKITNKIKRFTYYHDEKLKELGNSKYDKDVIYFAIQCYLEGISKPNYLKEFLPSKQLVNYYINTFNLEQKIEAKNQEILNKNITNLNAQNGHIFLEIDDLFIKCKSNQKCQKYRSREIIIHSKNNKKLNNVINIFFLKNLAEETNENNDLNFVIKTLKQNISVINSNKKLVVNGDGARWIRTISSNINAKYSLDLFHIKKLINDTFGYNKFASKENKIWFKNWISNKYNLHWKTLLELSISERNFQLFYEIYESLINEIIHKKPPELIISNINLFYKYIIKNASGIFEISNNFQSFTEHFVHYSFKKHIKKEQSLYCIKSLKMRIMFKNLIKGQATIFF
ncbi:Mbov_0401 family ICE element transposase-like protein [Metamycoplasma equirhinis]|uniref:Mbov_0401 family ICE element transposase-like protein n=1 Tax=Metamycoplasma equirhinis TaxID=92402 RepID=UPI00359441FC